MHTGLPLPNGIKEITEIYVWTLERDAEQDLQPPFDFERGQVIAIKSSKMKMVFQKRLEKPSFVESFTKKKRGE